MEGLRVIGWFGRRNAGDEAFRDVHKLLLPGVPMSWFHSQGGPAFQPELPLRDDIVLVSAGDIVSPFYFDQIPPSARIVVYGVGIAWPPQIDFLAKFKDRLVAAWVRNERDVPPLRQHGLKAFYTPDIVFNLAGSVKPNSERIGKSRVYVIISDNQRADSLRTNDLRRFFHIQSFFSELAAGIEYLQEWYDVTLVPFSFDKNDFDIAAIFDLLPRIPSHESVEIVEREMDFAEMIQFIGRGDLIITTKFHGVVYALMNKIPFVAISDARKTRFICEDNGFDAQWLPATGMSLAAFKAAVTNAKSPEACHRMQTAFDSLTQRAKSEADRFTETMMAVLSP